MTAKTEKLTNYEENTTETYNENSPEPVKENYNLDIITILPTNMNPAISKKSLKSM